MKYPLTAYCCCKGVCILHSILFNNVPVGQAQIKQEGLYHKITCQCVLPNKRIYRIKVSDGINDVDLGICVPEGDCFILTSRVAVKKLSTENLKFYIITNQPSEFHIADGKPFEALDKLEAARLQYRNGQLYVVID